MKEFRGAHGRGEYDPSAVGRPSRIVIWAGLRDQLLDRVVGDVEQVDVASAALNQVGIDRRAERDRLAVGRPRERTDAEIFALRPLRPGDRLFQRLSHVERPYVRIVVLLAHDLEIAEVVFALLGDFLVGVARGERDALTVFRPRESVDAVLGLGQLRGLAAVGIDDEDLILVADAIAGEGQPFARRRPLRIAGGLFAPRDLKRLARRRVRQPDLRDEGVLLPVRLA